MGERAQARGAARAGAPGPGAAAANSELRGSLGRRELLELCEFMKLNRRVEERLANLYRQGTVLGGLYRSLGQEAISVGAAYALGPGDLMAPLIRDLGAVLVRGYTPRECFAQYLGRASGPTGGRDGVIHLGDVEGRGVVAGMGMLGSLVAVLAGCGLALRMMRRDRVCLTFIGDGGASTSGFHDGLNLAAARALPLVVVVENNGYAYSTPVASQTNQPDFSTRGPAYGCAGATVDGNDILAVYEAARSAVARARAGLGPSVIEARTFRMKGHAEHDDASYVPRERFDEWRRRDPIERYEAWLVDEGVATREELALMAERIDTRLDEDVRWAEESPLPDPSSALAGVHAEESPAALAGANADESRPAPAELLEDAARLAPAGGAAPVGGAR